MNLESFLINFYQPLERLKIFSFILPQKYRQTGHNYFVVMPLQKAVKAIVSDFFVDVYTNVQFLNDNKFRVLFFDYDSSERVNEFKGDLTAIFGKQPLCIYSGHNYHFYYKIKNFTGNLSRISDAFHYLSAKYEFYDEICSRDVSRLARVPYTINSKTNESAYPLDSHLNRISLENMNNFELPIVKLSDIEFSYERSEERSQAFSYAYPPPCIIDWMFELMKKKEVEVERKHYVFLNIAAVLREQGFSRNEVLQIFDTIPGMTDTYQINYVFDNGIKPFSCEKLIEKYRVCKHFVDDEYECSFLQ